MRVLSNVEMGQVAGGWWWCKPVVKCDPKPVVCTPAPKCDPAPVVCPPAPKCDPKPTCHTKCKPKCDDGTPPIDP